MDGEEPLNAGVNIQNTVEQIVAQATPVNVSAPVPVEQIPQGAMNNQAMASIETMIGGNDSSANGSGSYMNESDGAFNEYSTGYSNGNNTQTVHPLEQSNSMASELYNKHNNSAEDTKPEELQPNTDNLPDWFDTSVQQNFDNSYGDMFSLGVNTVGQSLKNASHDIRGIVPCPKINGVSPWGNSSIEPDYNINGLGCN